MKIFDWILSKIGGQQYLPIQFHITNRCNLNCRHCYHESDYQSGKDALSLPEWQKVFDEYTKLLDTLRLKPSVIMAGGEPLVSKNLFPLIETIRSRYPETEIYILTNGTRVNDDIIDKLTTHQNSLQISLDGPNAETHDYLRGAGVFDSVVKNIGRLLEAQIPVRLSAILSKRSASFIEEHFKLAKQLGVDSLNFGRLIPQGMGKQLTESSDDEPLAPAALKDAMQSIVKYSAMYGVPTNTDKPLYCLIDPELGAYGGYGNGMIIEHNGDIMISARSDYVLGNVMESSLEKAFLHHPLMKKLRDGKIDTCGDCQYFRQCGGDRSAAFAATNDFLTVDPGCWYWSENQ